MFGPLAITSSLGFQNSRQSRTPTPANSPVPLSTCVWVVLLKNSADVLISYHFDTEKRGDATSNLKPASPPVRAGGSGGVAGELSGRVHPVRRRRREGTGSG
jgi:hypothetical protein